MIGVIEMLNTDIFEFEFVDRENERKTIEAFLSDTSNQLPSTLWVQGSRGVGKSFLIKEQLTSRKDICCVFVNPEYGQQNPGAYLKLFIAQVNKAADMKLSSYLRANYSSFMAIGQKALNTTLKLSDLDEFGLEDLTASFTDYFISKHGEKETSVTVIKKYLLEATKKHGRLIIILDNFCQCDIKSLDIISTVIHELSYDRRIKYIICTTNEDLESRFDVKSFLAEKIPTKLLSVPPMDNRQLFARMLERNFDLDETSINLIVAAFDICKGTPQKFKELLINLYASQGIILCDHKARLSSDIFKTLLTKQAISFDIEAFSNDNVIAKYILPIISLWGAPVSYELLYDLMGYLEETFSISFIRGEIQQVIINLEKIHVLETVFQDHLLMIKFKHDATKIAVGEYFKNDRICSFFHYTFYEYIMAKVIVDTSPYWKVYYKSLRAYHSFMAQSEDWISYNYQYGKDLLEEEAYDDAAMIFSRLETAMFNLNANELFIICKAYYMCGLYQKANDIILSMQAREVKRDFTVEEQISFYILSARIKCCLFDTAKAIEEIENAEKLCRDNVHLHIITQGVKQSILFVSPGGFQQAKQIFDDLVSNYSDFSEMSFVFQSAMDYYEGKESKELLQRGIRNVEENHDRIHEGKIVNNLGFEYLRCGDYDSALDCFNKSIKILSEVQPHEQAYPYSNRAVLYMILGQYDRALEDIMEALFWNKSNYASLVLKSNRMLCYYHLGNPGWEKLFEELFDYISTAGGVDDKIFKKVCINLAYLSVKSNKTPIGINVLERCKPHIESETPHGKYRFLKLQRVLTGLVSERLPDANSEYKAYYCDIEFEPWLINFTHDLD